MKTQLLFILSDFIYLKTSICIYSISCQKIPIETFHTGLLKKLEVIPPKTIAAVIQDTVCQKCNTFI